MWFNMSLKVHHLVSHLDYFPANVRDVIDEQRKGSIKKDIIEMVRRHQGRWNVSRMADYCCMLQQVPEGLHKRESTTSSSNSKRPKYYKESVQAE
jgi:hypothetical protein